MSSLYFDIQPETGQFNYPEEWITSLKNLVAYLDRKSSNFFENHGHADDKILHLIEVDPLKGWKLAFRLFVQFQHSGNQRGLIALKEQQQVIQLQFPSIDQWPFFRICFLETDAQVSFLSEYFSTFIVAQLEDIDDAELENWTKLWHARVQYYIQHIDQQEVDHLKIHLKRKLDRLNTLLLSAKGKDFTKSVFEKAFHQCAELFGYLPSFPQLITWLPQSYLNLDMIMHLSKEQMGIFLLEKIGTLEEVNKEILNSNEALNHAYSELDRAYQKMEQTLEQLNLFLNTVVEGILVSDQTGRIIMANSQASKLFGYSSVEMLNKSFNDLILELKPDGEATFVEHIEPFILKLNRLQAIHQDGQIFPLEISLNKAPYGGGHFIIAAAKDISEQIVLEGELANSRDNLEKLVYDRTRDLNLA
ncbi:MAG: PAS domain S-box protein, partial [Bacteroidota bacterium]